MARLGRRPRNLTQTGGTPVNTTRDRHPDFVTDEKFEPPLWGVWQGQIYNVLAAGNSTGMSATYKMSRMGITTIASQGEVRILNPHYIAPTTEQLDQLFEGVNFDQP